jgi:hypothetical protein
VESAEEYEVLQLGNASLLAERNDFQNQCEDLEARLVKARSDSATSIASLEAKMKSAEAHTVDVAAAGEKWLNDFEAELVRDLAGLQRLYICNVQVIRGLCSPMPEADPSTADYIRWLSMEVADLPEMFVGVNKNFVFAIVEGALVMAGESIDLDAFQDVAAESGLDIFPVDRDVRRVARAVSKKWWRSFGYNYVLAAIHA